MGGAQNRSGNSGRVEGDFSGKKWKFREGGGA